ncbi:hypothetical protein Tco_1497149, partial [Tanacetum coccineum]
TRGESGGGFGGCRGVVLRWWRWRGCGGGRGVKMVTMVWWFEDGEGRSDGGGRRRDDGVNGDGDDRVAAADVANGEAADLARMVEIWPEVGRK